MSGALCNSVRLVRCFSKGFSWAMLEPCASDAAAEVYLPPEYPEMPAVAPAGAADGVADDSAAAADVSAKTVPADDPASAADVVVAAERVPEEASSA